MLAPLDKGRIEEQSSEFTKTTPGGNDVRKLSMQNTRTLFFPELPSKLAQLAMTPCPDLLSIDVINITIKGGLGGKGLFRISDSITE